MSVDKAPGGRWRARWRDVDGRQRSKTFDRKIDAVKHEQAMRTDVARGDYVDDRQGRVTLAAWCDEWLDGARNLGDGGRATYRRDLDRYVLPALGRLPLNRVTADRIDRYLSDELVAGLAPSTVHRHYRTIRRALAVAVERGRLRANPCDPVTPPRVPPSEVRIIEPEQVEALADAMPDRYRALVLVAAYGGLRWSELVGLRRQAVDGVRLSVLEQLVRHGGEWQRRPPKSAAGRRVVTLPESVAVDLAAHVERWALPGPDGLVFAYGSGGPLIASSWRSGVLLPACRRAGLDPPVRPHDLRHTAVALAIRAGAHPKAVQERMGHVCGERMLDDRRAYALWSYP